MMNSQESANENNHQDLNSNQIQKEPEMPKGGFFDMVEHPSIRDEDYDEDRFEDDDEDQDVQSYQDDEGEFPNSARQ